MILKNYEEDYKVKVKFIESARAADCVYDGEFLEEIDIKRVIYHNLTNKDYLDILNNKLNTNFDLNSDINDLNITDIKVFINYDEINEIKYLPDDCYDVSKLNFVFKINDCEFEGNWICNPLKFENLQTIDKVGYSKICSGLANLNFNYFS